jgi:hypothetical protein
MDTFFRNQAVGSKKRKRRFVVIQKLYKVDGYNEH